ncbi:hypothetical protein Clacol_004720 [Clathrus columnatus]|uniref:Ribosome recycling factor domain-containing protein n=1 Tax=Clathrus columnatus TaxID=1419009 RepID=A0AAV5ACQ4_9AGAM|nr:hypothetical protein Clacol_004720 [Clathrus columnatus]
MLSPSSAAARLIISRTLSGYKNVLFQRKSIVLTRYYASNKPNSKGSHSTTTKNLIPASQRAFLDETIQSEYDKTSEKMTFTVEWVRKEVAGFIARGVGHVSPAILDPVRVVLQDENSRETKTTREVRLNDIATIGIREGNNIFLTLHNDDYFKPVEKAIYAAKIPSVVPQKVDPRTIRIVIPRPTMEARTALLQVASKTCEEARVQLRKAKDTIIRQHKWKPKSSETEQFQKLCDTKIKQVDGILAKAKQEFSN